MRKAGPPDGLLQAARAKIDNHPGRSWKRYRCTLVTPMYGGGTKAGEVDKDMPIRATAIRGQLRYWWRLLNRSRYPDSKALFEAERAIWGGLGDAHSLSASKVLLHIEDVGDPNLEPCADYVAKEDGRYPSMPKWRKWAEPFAYALFPGQGKVGKDRRTIEKQPASLIREGLQWSLFLDSHDLQEEQAATVVEAISWWATFGGVGARTRRGLGAVEVRDGDRILRIAEAELAERADFVLHTRPAMKTAMEAWQQALNALRDFRQGEGIGRNKGTQRNRPGRSRWLEPAAIRKITGQHRVKADGTAFEPGNAPLRFPRAAFGLPIIFHFQGDKSDQKSDPEDSELAPVVNKQKQERMASPLILRPYVSQDGKWHPAVLKLPDEHVWEMALQLGNSAKARNPNLPKPIPQGTWWPTNPDQATEAANAIRPMQGLTNDPLSAFMAFFSRASAGSSKSASEATSKAVEAAKEERWEKAQIKYNASNGSITAIGPNNRNAMALGDAGRAIWVSLSPQAQQKIRGGFFRAPVLIKGSELVKVEEQP